jgi:hypothetical protein
MLASDRTAIISLAVLMTWILCKTSKRLVPMVITHFSFNLGFALIGPQGLGIGPNLALMGIMAALLFVAAIVVNSTGGLSVKTKSTVFMAQRISQ